MSIWHHEVNLEALNTFCANTLIEHLGIRFVEMGAAHLIAVMPVTAQAAQPAGLLHGGASVVLAESLGSIGASLCIDNTQQSCLGLEINANHVRAVRIGGQVKGIARPLHIGRRTHVWEVHISDASGQLVCASRMTIAIVDSFPASSGAERIDPERASE